MRCVLLGVLLAAVGCDRLADRMIERNLARRDEAILTARGLHVFLCGTGSPIADPDRASACTAIIAGGEIILVDTGPGSWEVLDLGGMPTEKVTTVLLTHYHSDHIGDLGEAMTQGWIAGRPKPLDVYGPPGVRAVVDGFEAAYAQDLAYRVMHHGEHNLPKAAAGMEPHEMAVPAEGGAAVILERNGLRVTMFAVDHAPVRPAVGYRVDYAGRSVVISGDTKKSASLAAHAKGVDLLVHEALADHMIQRARTVMDRLGRTRLSAMAEDILDYHATPVQVAELARDAGVEHLVFTHLVPGPPNALGERMFAEGVADVFAGKVTLGKDGDRFDLEPRG